MSAAKALYWVNVDVTLYVLAEDESAAERFARRLVEQGADGCSLTTIAWKVGPDSPAPVARVVEIDWIDAYPFVEGDGEERTCGEIFNALAAEVAR